DCGRRWARGEWGGRGPGAAFRCLLGLQVKGLGVKNNPGPALGLPATVAAAPRRL
ncbi:INTS14 isoform 11, partial [Pongo abelii]